MFRRMLRRTMLVLLTTVLLGLTGAGIAAAECATPGGGSSTPTGGGTAAAGISPDKLPKGFPEDLRKFVAGTNEFKQGPWFSGPCASKGGDIGAYINGALAQENRLIYWSLPDEKKAQVLGFAIDGGSNIAKQEIDEAVKAGREPSTDYMPKVFPAGDPAYGMPTDTCANDLKGWATPENNAWGFQWARTPDAGSLDAMKNVAAQQGQVPGGVWDNPCGDGQGSYCSHAFFVNCDQATDSPASAKACGDWNRAVGKLYGGTAHWVDQNTGVGEKVSSTVSAIPAFSAGKMVVGAYADLLKGAVSAAKNVTKFVSNPDSVAAQWANDFKDGAIDVSTNTLQSIACSHPFDPTAPWFLKQYAVAMALGFIVMAFLAVHTVVRSGRQGSPRELVASLFVYLPTSIFVTMFAPLLASLLLGVTDALTQDVAKVTGSSIGKLIDNVAGLSDATADNFLGHVAGGCILFGGMLLSALTLWLGMLFHQYGLPLSGVVAGISVMMLVSPKWRKKALAPVAVFAGIALSVPLLFLLLGVVFATADAGWSSGDSTAASVASRVLFLALGFFLAALAPWALLKWAPILPSKDDFDTGSGQGVGSEVLGMSGNYMLYGRGGGSGDSGVGMASQPSIRGDAGESGVSGPAGVSGGAGGVSSPGFGGQQSGGGFGGQQSGRGDLAGVGQGSGGSVLGASPGVHGSGESAAAHGGEKAGAESAAKGAGTAAAGVATAGAAVAATAASAAITKAKSAAEGSAPTPDE